MSSNGDPDGRPSSFSGRTAWARSLETPLREFLRTETGSAAVLLAAAVAALVWVNIDASSYDSLWRTKLSIDLGGAEIALDLRQWVNSGLMTFFFFVAGLEARREFDLGELRERRRFALPLLAAIGGLVMGLLVFAYPAPRSNLERATERFREFREQPTADLARVAGVELRSATSPNERLQQLFHPWTSYLVVPLFALANAGIALDGGFLTRAFSSPITLGILVGYVVGKPVGILGFSWLATRLSRGRLQPPVGWAAVAGGGTIAGIGFTVSLLVATLAFDGRQLEEAKVGILSAALGAAIVTWLVFRATALLPRRLRIRALLGTAEPLVDLYIEVDPERDHVRGPLDAPVTLVEYGDFECPYCGQAEAVVRELLGDFGDVSYIWRHLPLSDVHPRAQLAAEAAEAADEQGAFWKMHDLLLDHQDHLAPNDLTGYAEQLGLDVERFTDRMQSHVGTPRVAEDVDSADLSGVSGTPTFFINGRRHYGAYDIDTLTTAVRTARARAAAAA